MMNVSIDPSLVAVVSLIRDFITIIAAIVGLITLNRWQSQLKWQTKFSSARQIMKLAKQYQSQFHAARGMYTYPGEGAGRVPLVNEPREEKSGRDAAYAHSKRLELVRQTLIELYQSKWEAEIVFKRDMEDLLEPFAKAFNETRIAIDLLLYSDYEQWNNSEEVMNMRKKVSGDASDEFGKSIDTATDRLSYALRKELGLRR